MLPRFYFQVLPLLSLTKRKRIFQRSIIKIQSKIFKNFIQPLHDPQSTYLLGPYHLKQSCIRQLGIFLMICRLPNSPLNKHARFVLTQVPISSRSWFHTIRDLCLQYNLLHPLTLLDCPPAKEAFKKEVKLRVTDYWLHILRSEAAAMRSLIYFNPHVHSLTTPSRIWSSAKSTPLETTKAVVVARIVSGRYRCESFCRHWTNSNGYCLAPTCNNVVGDVEHLLISCPALNSVRIKMIKMWEDKTVNLFPELFTTILRIKTLSPPYKVQFLLSPFCFPEVIALGQAYGQELIDHACYLTRTYVYYLHKEKQRIIMDLQKTTTTGKLSIQ